MLDLKWIRTNAEAFDFGLKRRGLEAMSGEILALDEKHRAVLAELQNLQTERNTIAKEFGKIKSQGGDTTAFDERIEFIKQHMPSLEQMSSELELEIKNYLSSIPNIPADDCPDGRSEEDNLEVRRVGVPFTYSKPPLQHFELGENLAQMDFERAAKLSGSRFVVLYNDLARLERAIAQFMLDVHTSEFGYTEVYTPYLVNDQALYNVGQLPKFHDDAFKTTTGHWLISTGEVTLTSLVADEILKEEELPLRFTSYTPCFRSEAGAAGRDTRGMIRQHQFSKVELVSITTPEQSIAEHERMTTAATSILDRLELPYRVMALCTGDMGFSAEKTYDIEVWLPGQNAYREISSCSRCGTFQARRMNARYRRGEGEKPAFVNTLNGSALAVGRTLIAVLENYQQEDGSIHIPAALQSYMSGKTKIEKIR